MATRKPLTTADYWRIAAADLDLAVVAPFELRLPSGELVCAEALVVSFGARRGTLIINDLAAVWGHRDEIAKEGYGFSVMDPPDRDEVYEASDAREMLDDWGWAGEDSNRPHWLGDSG